MSRKLLAPLLAAALLAGCTGNDDTPATVTVTDTATETVTTTESASASDSPSSQAVSSSAVSSSAPQSSAPAPEPEPLPAQTTPPPEAQVTGFTGAPGVDTPGPLDKEIAYCGDVGVHETGTTFFTDGTSGWTTYCAEQMGY